jgi:PAS domain S-box-containing protein
MTVDEAAEPREAWEEELFRSIAASPLAMVVTSCRLPDDPIVAVNAAFCVLTGYEEHEILGRNCRFLAGSGTDPAGRRALREAVAEGRPALTELVNYRKDGSSFCNAVMIAPVKDPGGALAYYLGSQMDVTDEPQLPGGIRRQRSAAMVARLSPRQRQVLELMIRGYRNKQIAPELGIDEKTVKMHRAGLLARLGVGTSAEAVRIGVEAGL